MIIVRSPLRITLGGGGTDIPSFYKKYSGITLSAAIDKYVYITINKAFLDERIIKYKEVERFNDPSEIQHPIFREALNLVPPYNDRYEITSLADVPAGTGVGSSGAFTCALLKALHTYNNEYISTEDLAEEACRIEIGILKEPVGKQDQYASAFGGINVIHYYVDGVSVENPNISRETRNILEDNLHLYFTNKTRSASKILKDMSNETENLKSVRYNGEETIQALQAGDIERFNNLINEQFELKAKRSGTTPETIIQNRQEFLNSGAKSVKLIGAGGGGFLMAYYPNAPQCPNELRFGFDYQGTRVL